MIKFVIIFCLVALTLAAPPRGAPTGNSKEIPIISYESVVNHDGVYKYSYEGGDGTKVQEVGQPNGESESVQGSFSFVGQDGVTYTVTYTADENGFNPQGAHLPVAPPIPEAIARSIEYNLAHPEEDTSQQ